MGRIEGFYHYFVCWGEAVSIKEFFQGRGEVSLVFCHGGWNRGDSTIQH